MQFEAEIENDLSAGRQNALARIEVYEALSVHSVEQSGGIRDAGRFPDDPDRRHEPADLVVRNGIGIGDFFHTVPVHMVPMRLSRTHYKSG